MRGWIQALRARQPGAPLWRIMVWYLLHGFCFVWFVLCYRWRAWGVRRIPEQGPIMFVCNHQSFYDPIIVGLGAHRRQFHALARSTLFDNKGLAWLIRLLNAIPVRQGAGDKQAMRACMDVLAQGHALLIFPEGARTLDGKVQRFEQGTLLLIKRARPRVVPVALEGAFDVWPRGRKLPRAFGKLGVMYGSPIDADELVEMGSEAAMRELGERVEALQKKLARRMNKEA